LELESEVEVTWLVIECQKQPLKVLFVLNAVAFEFLHIEGLLL